MKTIITLTEDQKELLSSHGNVVCGEYFHMPYWFKKTDDENVFEVMMPFNLPEYIRKSILDEINFGQDLGLKQFKLPVNIKPNKIHDGNAKVGDTYQIP